MYRREENRNLRYGCIAGMGLTLLGCVLLSSLLSTLLLFSDPLGVLAAFALATPPTLLGVAVLLWIDRNEREPVTLLLAAFAWGASASVVFTLIFAGLAEVILSLVLGGASDILGAILLAPFFEELFKGLGVAGLFVLFHREFDNVLDGLVYGAMIGLGFAWFEDALYFQGALAEGGPAEMLQTVFVRTVSGSFWSGHPPYTAMVGAGFGLVRVMRKGAVRWLMIPLFWGLAVFAHALWNSMAGIIAAIVDVVTGNGLAAMVVGIPLAVLILSLPFTLLLAVIVALAWRHERRLIKESLQDEDDRVVTDEELQRLLRPRRRVFESIRCLFRGGPAAWWRYERMSQEQIHLAFLKWHHDHDEGVHWPLEEDAEVHESRQTIARLRAN